MPRLYRFVIDFFYKTRLQEAEELLAANKKRTAEILEENNRVNLCLEENKKYLQEIEEVRRERGGVNKSSIVQ